MASAVLRRLAVFTKGTAALPMRHIATGMAALGNDKTAVYEFETLAVSQPQEWVTEVRLNRPEKSNAMNQVFWKEMVDCFGRLSEDSSCRVVLLTGSGKHFTSGLDLVDFAPMFTSFQSGSHGDGGTDVARKAFLISQMVRPMQDSFTAIEKCPKPVIACVHSACVGGGVDMITACDVRLCSQDAWFQVKETELGIVADIGTLQRLPKIVGNGSWAREVVYTARKVSAEEALKYGLVSQVFADKDAAFSGALEMADNIAHMSPVAVQGSKVNLNYSRDHTVEEGLNFAVVWNAAMLQSEDLGKAVLAAMQKEKPVFSKL